MQETQDGMVYWELTGMHFLKIVSNVSQPEMKALEGLKLVVDTC